MTTREVTGSMRALLQPRYGGPEVLTPGELPIPVPGPGEVRVRVQAVALNRGDIHALSGRPYLMRLFGFGLLRPKEPVPGFSLAGTVDAVGAGVEDWRPGDAVFGERMRGACAGFTVMAGDELAPRPAGLDVAAAACVPVAATTALQGLRDVAALTAGERLLVHGASGGVGGAAVQIGRALGAEVVAACRPAHVEVAARLGAQLVLDVSRDDPTALDVPCDVVLDVVGDHHPEAWRRILTPGGRYVAVGEQGSGDWLGPLLWMARVARAGRRGSQAMSSLLAEPRARDLRDLTPWLEDGRLTPDPGPCLPLERGREAFTLLSRGGVRGRVVLLVE